MYAYMDNLYSRTLKCQISLMIYRKTRHVSWIIRWKWPIECFHSRGQHLCKFIGTKESVCIRKEFNSHRIGLGHQHGCRFIVLGRQYGRRDVMWKHSIILNLRSSENGLAYTLAANEGVIKAVVNFYRDGSDTVFLCLSHYLRPNILEV